MNNNFISNPDYCRANLSHFIIEESKRLNLSYANLSQWLKEKNLHISHINMYNWVSDNFNGHLKLSSIEKIAKWKGLSFNECVRWLNSYPEHFQTPEDIIDNGIITEGKVFDYINQLEDIYLLSGLSRLVDIKIKELESCNTHKEGVIYSNTKPKDNKNNLQGYKNSTSIGYSNGSSSTALKERALTKVAVDDLSESSKSLVVIRLQLLFKKSLEIHSQQLGFDYRYTPSLLALKLGHLEGSFDRVSLNAILSGEVALFESQRGKFLTKRDWNVTTDICFKAKFIATDVNPDILIPLQKYSNQDQLIIDLVSSLSHNHY